MINCEEMRCLLERESCYMWTKDIREYVIVAMSAEVGSGGFEEFAVAVPRNLETEEGGVRLLCSCPVFRQRFLHSYSLVLMIYG